MRQAFLTSVVLLCVTSSAFAQTLRIYHIDVEQADAALIVMPNGKSLLIDSGNDGHGKRITKVMNQAGVTHIDAFVASHYHADHYGGVHELVEDDEITILESYDRGRRDLVKPEDKTKPRFKEYMRTVGEDAIPLEPGDTIDLDSRVKVTCIAASGAVAGASPLATQDENELSVSLLIEFAGFKAFFGGDSHTPVETLIEGADLVQNVDLYKSSHHGSDTSSSAAFMRDLNPTLIVISNGSNGTYKHPRAATLQAYQALTPTPTVIQMNRCKISAPCGNVPSAFIADAEQSGKDGTVQVVVDATTRTYTARYGLSTIRSFAFKASPGVPVSPPSAAIAVIQSLLPNPEGDDAQLEEVTLRNPGTAALNLTGWALKDRSGLTWTLTGGIPAGGSSTFRRGGQPMTLNNGGDEIVLIDPAGVERDRFSYATSSEDEQINTNH